MAPVAPGRLLKREMVARKPGANRLSLDIGAPSVRITIARTISHTAWARRAIVYVSLVPELL
jgi:hypothetical protein